MAKIDKPDAWNGVFGISPTKIGSGKPPRGWSAAASIGDASPAPVAAAKKPAAKNPLAARGPVFKAAAKK